MDEHVSTLLRMTRVAAAIVGAWLVATVFFGWQHHRLAIERGSGESLGERLAGTAVPMLLWALFTPVVLYLGDRFPLRKPRRLRNGLLTATVAVAVAATRALLDGWLAVLTDVPLTLADYSASVIATFHTHLLLALLLMGVANFLRLERDEETRRHAEVKLEAELAEAKLRQLRADLQPHFLFNALNAVAALLHTDQAAAAQALSKLHALLRASVAASKTREVRLEEELCFIGRYLDVQKMRFADKLRSAIVVADPRLCDAAVPPLLLQPLVENSIVHGVARCRDGGSVEVVVDTEQAGGEEWLRLEVRDSGPGFAAKAAAGRGSVGVPNAMARLESMYGSRQSLRYLRRGDSFVAEVLIPLRMVA